MRAPVEFDIKEFSFKLSPLPVLESIDLSPTVLGILPTLGAIKKANEEKDALLAMASMRRIFQELVPIINAFQKVCEVKKEGDRPHYLPMTKGFDNLFSQEHLVLVQWAIKCIEYEFESFLVEAFQKPEEPEKESS
jgi:hypothetical protein